MKSFQNLNAESLQQAATMAQQARTNGQVIAFSGGGTDLLQQVKDGTVTPDVLINLRNVPGMDQVSSSGNTTDIGGLISLNELSNNQLIRNQYTVLAEAAEVVGTPQIRNVGTLSGNLTQRPWCWYYRNGFNCYKAGGNECFSVTGENQQHAIFGGGPSYIVHPSDTAPALVALGAEFTLVGPTGERNIAAESFFRLPSENPQYENVLTGEELLASIRLPVPQPGSRSAFHKVMDREAWTHAVVSVAVVLEMNDGICTDARIVLGGVAPIPWRVTEAENLLRGMSITPDLARQAGETAIADARPLAKNAYKIPMVSAVVERTVLGVSAA